MADQTVPPELRQPGEQLPLLLGRKASSEAVSEPQGGPEPRNVCGPTADEIVIEKSDAVEVPVE